MGLEDPAVRHSQLVASSSHPAAVPRPPRCEPSQGGRQEEVTTGSGIATPTRSGIFSTLGNVPSISGVQLYERGSGHPITRASERWEV